MAIDANLELAEEEDCFHVFGYLKKIRQSRKGLIENVVSFFVRFDALQNSVNFFLCIIGSIQICLRYP